jgi:hypothetical protein
MKVFFLIISIFIGVTQVVGQATGSSVEVITTYSQNEEFHLTSIPYDNEFPSLRGRTSVYQRGSATPLYVFDRGFDSVDDDSNNLILSNDGEIILFIIPWGADETQEGLKSVTVYQRGKIIKSYTATEITGCDEKKERCSLVYSNYDEVVDKNRSKWGTANYKKVLKAGTNEKERFLSDFPIFSFDDTVYLTDFKKQVHSFDLGDGSFLESKSFDSIFEQIKGKGRFVKTKIQRFNAPVFLEFPKLKNGEDAYKRLAAHIGMTPADISGTRDESFKLYSFKISTLMSRDGSLEIKDVEFYDELPKEKIIEFFKTNKFDSSSVPKAFDKWYIGNEYFTFRKSDARLARREKQQEIAEERKALEERLTLEKIDGVYIPKNLGECFLELDRLTSEIDKKEMQAQPKRDDMIHYHITLGMWMRNNWKLWGGSRLQKYFTDKGITHPDEMSSIILYHYHDWLNGKKETWKDWENNPSHRLVTS